jgi:hypothetical protein
MKKYKSKIKEDVWVLIDKKNLKILQELNREEAGVKLKEIIESGKVEIYAIQPMQFKHLSNEDKRKELLNELENYRENFDNTDHNGRGMRDVFALDRQRYEFVIDYLKANENDK